MVGREGNLIVSMDRIVDSIYDKIKDFRNDEGVHVTHDSINNWALQFGDDAEFMLTETNNVLGKTYLSKEQAIVLFRNYIKEHLKRHHYSDIVSYLKDVCYLRLQPADKSQNVIVDMVEDIIRQDYGLDVSDFTEYPKKLFIYFDDVLITGGTILADLTSWINQGNRLSELNAHSIKLEVDLIVEHCWGQNMMIYRLGKFNCPELNINNIHIFHYYEVENHLKLPYTFGGQKLNAVAIPIKESLSSEAIKYWEELPADKHADYAFRVEGRPANEEYFTSADNRIRFERILVDKGLYIISQIQGEIKGNIRPLGFIYPSYKTFGVGSLFFTWRNVPNNTPLVFWWDVIGHNWKPLFPAKRG